jgi:hypothetical protein
MGINRFDVYGSGSATASDLQLDSARRELGNRIKSVTITGSADISSTSKYSLVALDSPNAFDIVGVTGIVSDDATDVSQFLVEGVGSSGEELSEFVTLNGTSAVTLANTYSWVNTCQMYTGGVNSGTVSLQTSGSDTYKISPKAGNLHAGAWGIPAGYKAMVNGITVNAHGSNTEFEMMLGWSQDGSTNIVQLWYWKVKTFSNMPSWFDIPAQIISEYRNGIVGNSTGGLVGLYAKAVTGTTTISFTGNVMLTQVDVPNR